MHTDSNMNTNLNAQVGIVMNSFCYIMYNNVTKVYNMYIWCVPWQIGRVQGSMFPIYLKFEGLID